MKVKSGQLWESIGGPEFRIINVTEVEDHTWVHYRNEKTGQEYSCYQESFVGRFSQVVNRKSQGDKK